MKKYLKALVETQGHVLDIVLGHPEWEIELSSLRIIPYHPGAKGLLWLQLVMNIRMQTGEVISQEDFDNILKQANKAKALQTEENEINYETYQFKNLFTLDIDMMGIDIKED